MSTIHFHQTTTSTPAPAGRSPVRSLAGCSPRHDDYVSVPQFALRYHHWGHHQRTGDRGTQVYAVQEAEGTVRIQV